jgi:hypothetical protein
MKRIAAVVAVALLAAPVVLAQSAQPQSVPQRASGSSTALGNPSDGSSNMGSQVEGSFQGSYSTDPRSGPWTPAQGSFQGSYSTDPRSGTWSNIETSFQDTYSGN